MVANYLSEIHLFAVTNLSIIGHAGEVERTFGTLGKIRANFRHDSEMKAAEAGK
jgi:hypothetical protein